MFLKTNLVLLNRFDRRILSNDALQEHEKYWTLVVRNYLHKYIIYNNLIPSYDNFELSFYFVPTTVDANNTILLSQGETNDEYSSVSISVPTSQSFEFDLR